MGISSAWGHTSSVGISIIKVEIIDTSDAHSVSGFFRSKLGLYEDQKGSRSVFRGGLRSSSQSFSGQKIPPRLHWHRVLTIGNQLNKGHAGYVLSDIEKLHIVRLVHGERDNLSWNGDIVPFRKRAETPSILLRSSRTLIL